MLEEAETVWLYVVMTSPEARWLLYWTDKDIEDDPTLAVYGIRATQGHSGVDLNMKDMYTEVGLENFKEDFDIATRWYFGASCLYPVSQRSWRTICFTLIHRTRCHAKLTFSSMLRHCSFAVTL